jgi:serine/threonine protein kinase
MASPSTADEFLEVVRKSNVLEPRTLAGHVAQWQPAAGSPGSPASLAEGLVRDGLLTTFQAEQLLQGKWRNLIIAGKYKLLDRLGSGGMATVFLCEHRELQRRVALKVLPASQAENPAILERFHREARAVAALDHPNIVKAHDVDQDGKLHFLVMEYVEGSGLEDLIRRQGPMEVPAACQAILQAAEGLQHAHEAGLVHRDIKPANILMDRGGTVKILDMGLARFFHDDHDNLTHQHDAGTILGTADYMSPEQSIDSHDVDIRADIYSLGATFYFLLTGTSPFGEGTLAQKFIWHQIREPRPLGELRNDVPEQLAEVIATMMAKGPEERYQTPAEVVEALLPFVGAAGVVQESGGKNRARRYLDWTGGNSSGSVAASQGEPSC